MMTTGLLRPYLAVLKLRFQLGMQYRTAALAGMATQLFFGFIFIMVYEAFYTHAAPDVVPPMSLQQICAYIWLQQAFLSLITLWFRDNELFQLIATGNIAYELCRPAGVYGFWYSKLLAQRIASALLRCIPVLLVAMLLLPEPYRMAPPTGVNGLLFVVAMLLGLLLVVSISMLVYTSVFVTLSPMGSLLLFSMIGDFLAGMMIPVPLMPDWLQTLTAWLPFRYTVDFPFRVYSGHIPSNEALQGMVIQLVWLLALVGFGRFVLGKALRRVVVQGG
ncbi:ABC transporter permease [Paenibacillus koleovorans]|uniref:ABC transporter permease n=1 Tax=Paenibacillus koleovorans TaxID=121608 RepID=UPI0027D8DDA3|nr:ABC transporter permease [Paenibacillus koleovorans]